MVYVTHDQAEPRSMADQVVLMRDGQVEQDAAPPELHARPASVFAAAFIGRPPMSLPHLVPGAAGGEVRGAPRIAVAPHAAAGAILGIRPEEVSLANEGGLPAVHAQVPIEIVLNYPIAVGGPIPRIIDGYYDDLARENPGFRGVRSTLAPTRTR